MRGKRWSILVLAVSILTVTVSGCSSGNKEETKGKTSGKVAYITGTGGLGDKSFNDLGYVGIETLMGEDVECDVAEPQSISEIEGIARNFAEDGNYALIISMGGESVDSISAVAADYPKQQFMVVDGTAGVDNIKAVEVNQNETGFLAGAYAAVLMKEGVVGDNNGKIVIGAVGGMDIPLIRGILTGFECGVHYVCPDAEVLTSYVGDWSDPSKASELTQAMYEQGANIVFQAAGSSGLGVIECAENKGQYAIGYDGNQNILAPDHMVGSAIRGVASIIVETAHDALAGKDVGGDYLVSLCDNEQASQILLDDVGIKIPDSVVEQYDHAKEILLTGDHVVPSDRDGIDAFMKEIGQFE